MGRWKNDGSGNPVWDANDSGPDQIQGMPAGGPQGGAQGGSSLPPASDGWGGGGQPSPWNMNGTAPTSLPPGAMTLSGGQGGPSPSPQGQANGQPFQGGGFNPPNVWQQPDEAEKPGWGPIKISTHYQPGDGHPHPFERGFHMPGGPQGGAQGGNTGAVWGPNGQLPMLGQPPNTAGTPTPNPGEDYQAMFSRYLNDYHAPDRDQVLANIGRNDPNPIMDHLDGRMQAQDGRAIPNYQYDGASKSTAGDFTPNPNAMAVIRANGGQIPQGGGGFLGGGLLGALLGRQGGGSAFSRVAGLGSTLGGGGGAGGTLSPELLRQLMARMNGGQ